MLYFGAKLGRYKIMLYPLMFVINPFFNWVYMVYGIFTAGQRTWGGPRADAGSADTQTTPQQAIEQAEADGDDLNVVPETFKPSAEAHKHRPAPIPLLPGDNIDGRFAAAERLPGGWYQQGNESGLTLPNTMPRNPNVPNVPLHPRSSMDSFVSAGTSAENSVYMPRRVESFMDPEDARLYHKTQQTQKPAGGAYFEEARQHNTHESSKAGKSQFRESVDSDDDDLYMSKGQKPPPSGLSKDTSSGLEAPKPSYSRNNSNDPRSGRSPLARRSYVRTGEQIEMEASNDMTFDDPQMPAASDHQRSESTESKQRKRLSKAPPQNRK